MTARTSIHVVRVSLAILTCALVTQPALADPDYLPLQVGNTWSYEGSGGYAETMTVIGTTEVLGEVVSVIDYSASTSNEPLENYWTRASDGDVMLWGFFRDEEGAKVRDTCDGSPCTEKTDMDLCNLCGDCVEVGQYLLEQGETFDFVFGDPPFNIGHGYAGHDDNMAWPQFQRFMHDWLKLGCRLM